MLGKLLKYEFKATYRIFLPFFAALLAVTAVAKLFLFINEQFDNVVTNVFSGLMMTLYGLALVVIGLLPTVISIYRFYKNLVTDEGYLSFTLPVTPMQQIMTKFITSMVWCIIGVAVTIVTLVLMLLGTDVVKDVLEGIWNMFQLAFLYGSGSTVAFIFEYIALAITGVLAGFTTFYLCIALGQMLFKNKLLGSFAVFGIYYVATQIISLLLTVAVFIIMSVAGEAADPMLEEIMTHVILVGSSVLNIAFFFVCLFVTNHIFKKRLNLA